MNIHKKIDEIAIGIGSVYGDSMKFFNREMESETLSEIIRAVEIPKCSIPGRGEFSVDAAIGAERLPLRYRIMNSFNPEQPVLIFHHGSGDQPYYSRIKKIINSSPADFKGITVIATDSPYNRNRKEYFNAIGSLRCFTRILAVSAVLIEKLVSAASGTGCGSVTVSGISLGGWVSNIHHAFFNTASEYRPVFAGGAPDSLFLDSAYSKMTSQKALSEPSLIKKVLNFEEVFISAGNDNVFPLLAEHDRYIIGDRQKIIYDCRNIRIIEKGHITGSADKKTIAGFLSRR